MNDDAKYELSIIMPCLNEAETIVRCINKAKAFLERKGVSGEVVIADNGSTDGSDKLAVQAGARVVNVEKKGYGSALIGGIQAAQGKYIIMGDADDSYDFYHLDDFVDKLREGNDLVMGNRFKGGIAPNAMPFLHKYLGNPVLTKVGQIFFKSNCGDFHCGLRGFAKASIEKLDLHTTGMEFATEMVVKASLSGLKIIEVPTTLSPDGRTRPPHLRTWRDGWRHLRFMLLYCPNWLFLYPGLALMALGVITGMLLFSGPITIGGIIFDIHTLLYAAMVVIIGFQSVLFAVISKIFGITEGLIPPSKRMDTLFRYLKLETGLICGAITVLIGLSSMFHAVAIWQRVHFGNLDVAYSMRIVIPSATLMTVGFQTILFSFLFSMLGLERK